MSIDHIANAMRLRGRAEECRTLALAISDRVSATQYAGLAESYDTLARSEEQLAERDTKGGPP